tara:strand:- start:259 stop:522 length:264 start_codon:yes stop_codon:yes gene_type:complete
MDDQEPIQLTRAELKELLQEAVTGALVKLGMDIQDPLEMQRDFQHLRDWRIAVNSVQAKSILVMVTLLVTGAAAALWVGLKASISGP